MPSSDFERALHERVEFAVFVAYEEWARGSGYASFNPYDLLARLLPGLPEALSQAVEARGGWGQLDPVAGLATDEARLLVSQLVGEVVDRLVGTHTDHVPDGAVLAEALSHAVGRAVNGFVDDPESWRLASVSSVPGPVAALDGVATDAFGGEPPSSGQTAAAPAALSAAAAAQAEEPGGEWSAAPDSAISEIETWLHSFLVQPVSAEADSALAFYVTSIDTFSAVADAMAVSPVVTPPPADDLGSYHYELGDGSSGRTSVGDALGLPGGDASPPELPEVFFFPPSLETQIARWLELLNTATFYRVLDGGLVRLDYAGAFEVVERVVETLVERAALRQSLDADAVGWRAHADHLLSGADPDNIVNEHGTQTISAMPTMTPGDTTPTDTPQQKSDLWHS